MKDRMDLVSTPNSWATHEGRERIVPPARMSDQRCAVATEASAAKGYRERVLVPAGSSDPGAYSGRSPRLFAIYRPGRLQHSSCIAAPVQYPCNTVLVCCRQGKRVIAEEDEVEHRRDRTDVQRILSSWVADDRDERKPWIDHTAYDVHDIRCYRLSTWTERGIFPVEWYNRDRPSQPPCAQLYAFLESFWRSVLARPVDQHCYRYYDELENGPALVREFVSRLSLARVQAFLGMAGISWRRPPKAPDCHHEWCDHRWR